MAHPRASFPASIVAYYQRHGSIKTCAKYRANWGSLRRWLVEHGHPIRGQGKRIDRERGAA
jgi:hypothetical protein